MKIWTDIQAAIEEAEFEAKERNRQMFVMQVDGCQMAVSQDSCYHGGRVMYRTGVRR